jgi:hypothetical protein
VRERLDEHALHARAAADPAGDRRVTELVSGGVTRRLAE